MFSRRQSPEQLADIAALKDQGFVDAIKQQFPQLVSRRFAFHEIRDFFIKLNGAGFGYVDRIELFNLSETHSGFYARKVLDPENV